MTIDLAVEHSKIACGDEVSQTRLVCEFLVVCRRRLGIIIAANPSARSLMDAVAAEFSLQDPQFLGLLQSRMPLYFAALETRKTKERGGKQTLVKAMANPVRCQAGDMKWSAEVFAEAIAYFLTELVLPLSRSIV